MILEKFQVLQLILNETFIFKSLFGFNFFTYQADKVVFKVVVGVLVIGASIIVKVGGEIAMDFYSFISKTKRQFCIVEYKKLPNQLSFFKVFHFSFQEKQFMWGYKVQVRDVNLNEKLPENFYTLKEMSENVKSFYISKIKKNIVIYLKFTVQENLIKISLIAILSL